MSALDRWAPRKGSCVFRPAIAACVLTAALLVTPTAANACPSYANVKSYSGTADASYAQSASGPYEPGPAYLSGISTVSIDHVATGLQMKSLKLIRHKHNALGSLLGRGFAGPTSGGTIDVHDTIVDQANSNVPATGTQEGTGPTGNRPVGAGSVVQLGAVGYKGQSLGCKYQVAVNYTVLTTIATTPASGGESLEIPSNWRIGFLTESPPMPIPAGLHLKGAVTVPVGPTGTNMTGYYQFTESAWGPALSSILGQSNTPFNTATFGWNLKPTFTGKHK
jgi:hypothetical protein